ncbi:glycoside hydrolase family 127 protein [Flavobacterium johnsoniae]|uniref:beta-L-arabinofuranosidase domain-containing protein n=1 Tax=Flavobacterium johnsoniae TaxID=986 RepID=UPI0025AFDDCC|nr:beta-L-arabinofuranosidase domain-containing protein [Flavobacterium johnsoniae]WJS93833.1 glycoside hydrolase family 127 protein [Flavobacterium johnsoniae]
MKNKIVPFLVFACFCAISNAQTKTPAYVDRVFDEIPLGQIKPSGWLKDQLLVMSHNSTGHIDETYKKIQDDNGWLGGKGDGWEETPYWLDGAVPLAYQIDDKALKEKVLKYINWTIDNQRPSGYFGPITKWERETGNKVDVQNSDKGEDWWPKMVMLKVIQQYYTATNDKRVLPFMTKFFDYQMKTLDKSPIGKWTDWSASRGSENIQIVQWLYTINKDKNLLALAEKIKQQSFEWSKWLGNRDWVIAAAVNPNGEHWMRRHGVNVAMALKEPAENYLRTGDSTYLKNLKTGFNDLMTLHGLPNGIFSADEDLHGNAPTQGTELCAIVEAMYSLEDIIGITGETSYMDALERATFNAMPSQTTDSYNEKQYFQMANQIEIQRGVYAFSLPFDRQMNNVLGARSGYTCCYANMHQGWTKFTQHLWYRNKNNGIAALIYSPNVLSTTVGTQNEKITITENTQYPFNENIDFQMEMKKAVQFPFQLRIPSWCTNAEIFINNQKVDFTAKDGIVTLDRKWNNKDKLTLKLPMKVNASSWADNSKVIERGPLVYALKMNENWSKDTQKEEGEYFTLSSTSNWNYGLLEESVKNLDKDVEVKQLGLKENFKWNLANAPIELSIKSKQIPDWKAVNGLAYLPVSGRDGVYKGNVNNVQETITLVPIGFTKLRIVAFPLVK